MNLEKYKNWYVRDEGHLYINKSKQINSEGINEMARALRLFHILFTCHQKKDKTQFINFKRFAKNSGVKNVILKNNVILKSRVSSLYLTLEILSNNLYDPEQMKQKNEENYIVLQNMIKDHLEEKSYKYFIDKYDYKFLNYYFIAHFRNYKTWLDRLGFFGFDNNIFYITEVGEEFIKHSDDIELTNAIFEPQTKKYRIWNPKFPTSVEKKYKKFDVIPYYLILQILLKFHHK